VINKRVSPRTGRVSYRARIWVTIGAREVERSKTFTTNREAVAWERAQLTAKSVGEWIDPSASKVTLADWSTEVWPVISKRWAASTGSTYELGLRLRVLPDLGALRLAQITPAKIEAAVANWSESVSRSTVQNTISVLSAHLDYAVQARRLRSNPVLAYRRPKDNTVRSPHRPLDELEFYRLAVACSSVGGDALYGDVVLVLAYTGLRWSELAALQVENIDLPARRLWIRQALVSVRGTLTLGVPKSGKARTVPIPGVLIPALNRRIDGRTSGRLIVGTRGAVLRSTTFRAATEWPATSAALGFPSLRVHDLRASAIDWMLSRGVPVHVVRSIVGHGSLNVTDLYARSSDHAIDLARRILDDPA